MLNKSIILLSLLVTVLVTPSISDPTSPIRINQVGYEINGPKTAVYQTTGTLSATKFDIINSTSSAVVFTGDIVQAGTVAGWNNGNFYVMDFSGFKTVGKYKVKVGTDQSFVFDIKDNCLFLTTMTPLFTCLGKMRSKEADNALPIFGTSQKIDLHGGYKEASGDEAKHICHLQFSNYMPTNEIPECVWGLLKSYELNGKNFDAANLKTKIMAEIAFGADYLNRACSADGYFYSTVFDGWGEIDRTVCAYTSTTGGDYEITGDYQTAFREGGGLSIAALAKASAMKIQGDYTSAQYLATAKRAYTHIKANNLKYANDGKENFLDQLEAALATIELYSATQDAQYKTEAGEWITKILAKQQPEGWFYCDDAKQRPYFHAASEGLPILVLSAYLDIDNSNAAQIKAAIKKNIDWYCTITHEIVNPFNYVRLYARPFSAGAYKAARKSFFIPHNNESSYWWQGENARIGSMAAALLIGAKVLEPNFIVGADSLSRLAVAQLDWILGKNPFESCMQLGSGTVNYDISSEGGIQGGICNGIAGNNDAGGIQFTGDWRSCEQWLPHESYYLFATSVMTSMLTGSTPVVENTMKHVYDVSIAVSRNNNTVSIVLQGDLCALNRMNIYDMKGKKIGAFDISGNNTAISLNVNNLSCGMHVFELIAGGKKTIRKFVL